MEPNDDEAHSNTESWWWHASSTASLRGCFVLFYGGHVEGKSRIETLLVDEDPVQAGFK